MSHKLTPEQMVDRLHARGVTARIVERNLNMVAQMTHPKSGAMYLMREPEDLAAFVAELRELRVAATA